MSKTILITGATDGIGLLTAEKLIDQGHQLILHGRNSEKLAAVKATLSQRTTSDQKASVGQIDSVIADLSDLNQVQQLANTLKDRYSHLDVIINNAGIYKTNQPITADGLDVRFVVNTLSPYLLTQQLRPIMNDTSRVVNLSSAAQAPVNLDALIGETHLPDQMAAYAQSKLAITMWTRTLAEAWKETGPAIIAVNPGSLLASKMVKEGFGVAGKDLSIGADILIKAALSEEFENASGRYFDNDIEQFAPPHSDGLNDQKCQDVVDVIERVIGRFVD